MACAIVQSRPAVMTRSREAYLTFEAARQRRRQQKQIVREAMRTVLTNAERE
jgi:hypothetical protein